MRMHRIRNWTPLALAAAAALSLAAIALWATAAVYADDTPDVTQTEVLRFNSPNATYVATEGERLHIKAELVGGTASGEVYVCIEFKQVPGAATDVPTAGNALFDPHGNVPDAVDGEDYEGTQILSRQCGLITEGADVLDFFIPITDDNIQEETEHFFIAMTPSLSAGVWSSRPIITPMAQVFIKDNDSDVEIRWNPSMYQRFEDNETHTVTVERVSGPTDRAVPFTIETRDGTATAGQDFKAGPYEGTIAAGEDFGSVEIQFLDDDIAEPNETFTLHLVGSDTHGVTVSDNVESSSRALVTLEDDDEMVLSFKEPYLRLKENSTGIYTLQLSKAVSKPVTLGVTSDNTSITVPESFVIEPGSLTANLPVTAVLDDNCSSEKAQITTTLFHSPVRVSPPFPSGVAVVVEDACPLSTNKYAVWGNVGSPNEVVPITIKVGEASVQDQHFSILSVADPSISTGTPKVPTSATLQAGKFEAKVNVTLPNDASGEYVFNVTPDEGNPFVAVDPLVAGTASVYVHGDPVQPPNPNVIEFVSATYSVKETDASVPVTVRASNPFTAFHLYVAVTGGTASLDDVQDEDGRYRVTFPKGVGLVSFQVIPLADETTEGNETLVLSLEAVDGEPYLLGEQTSATVTIVDDSLSGEVEFAEVTYVTEESDGNGIQIKVNRHGTTTEATGVYVKVASGVATVGDDFSLVGMGDPTDGKYTLTLPAGASSTTFTFQAVCDNVTDGGSRFLNENAVLVLEAVADAPYALGDPFQTEVLILDNCLTPSEPTPTPTPTPTAMTVEFASATYSGKETDDNIRIYVNVTNPRSEATTVYIKATGGTASIAADDAENYDYQLGLVLDTSTNFYQLTVPANMTSVPFSFVPRADSQYPEGDETVVMLLTTLTNSPYTVGDTSSTTVTITDVKPGGL